MRKLKITANDGTEYISRDWSYALVEALEKQAEKFAGGVKKMELINMSDEEYMKIPATIEAARFFDKGVARYFD